MAQTPGPARPGASALIRRLRHVNQRVTVPYWIVALMLVAVVVSSIAAIGTVRAAPAPAAGPAPIVRTLTIPDGEGLNAGGSSIAPAATTDQSIVQLQQAIAALSANLERTQRDNAALRDQQRQQAQDLAQAVDGTVLSQQQRSGEVRDTEAHGQQQEQQLHGQYQGLTQGVAGQLSSLQQKAAAAAQVANRLRAALGLS
ncbi:MAG TPA: hypothetical protein VFI42_16465 [Thermomicrobiaceae bacterium]|nr:hypothetical protein [Thermomicrobiaceae bacterium]